MGPQRPPVSYVEAAMARAKEAAGEKDVLVHGAGTAPPPSSTSCRST